MAIRFLAAALILGLMVPFAAAQGQSNGISVSQAWSRATPGGVRNGTAYLQISSKGPEGDKLVGAKSDIAGQVELHNHIHEGGMMKMRRVDAIDVPAGETVKLEPGGFHVMLMDLKRPLKAGESFDLTLVFEKAGDIPVKATVEPIGAKGPGGQHGGMHKH